jgi:hypothetical protein
MVPVCPDNILALFKSEDTKPEGRRRAVEWMRGIVDDLRPGDKLLIPNPETGELMEFEKGERALQS